MPEKELILLAAGGHGAVVLDTLICAGSRVAGIIDPGKAPGSVVFGVSVVGNDEWLDHHANPDSVLLANGAGARPGVNLRFRLFDGRKRAGYTFISVRHPSATVGQDVVLSEGCQLLAGTVVQCRAVVGVNVVVNTQASVDHDCVIDAHAFIGPGATLCGEVRVGEHAFIGAGAVILPGISIGREAIIGAGIIVTRDVPGGTVVTRNLGVETRKPRS